MMKSISLYSVILWVLFVRFVRRCWTRTVVVASDIARKIFLPAPEPRFLAHERLASDRVTRLRYLARLSQRQLRLARRFGTFAEELLSKGRTATARRVAWGAFLHWQYARKTDRTFEAEAESARRRVVA